MAVETTTRQTKECIEANDRWQYDNLYSQLNITQQLLLDSLILSANFEGYKGGLDYAIKQREERK